MTISIVVTLMSRLRKIYLTTQFVTYIWVGIISNGADVFLYWILTKPIGMYYLFSSIISTLVGLLLNFSLHKRWTFKSNQTMRREIPKYVILATVNYFLLQLLLFVLVDILDIHYLLGKLIALGVIIMYNFLVLRFWIFTHQK